MAALNFVDMLIPQLPPYLSFSNSRITKYSAGIKGPKVRIRQIPCKILFYPT